MWINLVDFGDIIDVQSTFLLIFQNGEFALTSLEFY